MVWYGLLWIGMFWCGLVGIGKDWYGLVWYGMVWYGFVGIVWYGGGGQMTSEFIHEEISIMDYNGLSWTIMGGVTTGMDDWDG